MYFNKNKKIFFFAVLILFVCLPSGIIFALEINYPGLKVDPKLPDFIAYFFNIGIILAGFAGAIAIAYGGILWLFGLSIGQLIDKNKGTRAPGEAKEWIKAGVWGLVITTASWLIMFTINPQLVGLELDELPDIILEFIIRGKDSANLPFDTYSEIPIGKLAENSMTRTINCYSFSPEGLPIDGEGIITDSFQKIPGPTNMGKDRIYCLLQLIDGAQKTSLIISKLSDEITRMMDTCECTEATCNTLCKQGNDRNECKDPMPDCKGKCEGPCAEDPKKATQKKCEQANGTKDCCPEDSGVPDPKNKKKNLSVKEVIEKGPIKIGECPVDKDGNKDKKCCGLKEIQYKGLDEFRCNPEKGEVCSNISWLIEDKTTYKYDEKPLTIINIDGNQGVKTEKKWVELTLIQKLIYLKEKISELKETFNQDSIVFNKAVNTLNSKQCYLTTPYVDLLKEYESTDKNRKLIMIEKPFLDIETNEPVDPSKYCEGFNYANSDCFKQCNDYCPDTSQQAIQLYKQCKTCKPGDSKCLNDQQECIKKAFGERPCLSKPEGKDFKTYNDCVSGCQSSCSELCDKKFLNCTTDYDICSGRCDNNSKCILEDKSDSCLFDSERFVYCANNSKDQGNIDFCIKNAYSCKNGSNQFAGYQDCISAKEVNSDPEECSSDKFSSSFLYENQNCLKCRYPYGTASPGSECFSREKKENKIGESSCQELCPEVKKCPKSSECPNCPCEEIDEEFEFSIDGHYQSIWAEAGIAEVEADDGLWIDDWWETPGEAVVTKEISGFQIVGPQCNGYLLNDDPLTFYCQTGWWNNSNKEGTSPIAIGAERQCERGGEIPVGQMVDDARIWIGDMLKFITKEEQNIQELAVLMKTIGEAIGTNGSYPFKKTAQDYCKCDARFENNETVCNPRCDYSDWPVEVPVAPGAPPQPPIIMCGCNFVPCQGNPCQQMIMYLSEIWEHYKHSKTSYIDLYSDLLQDPRSEILKKLTYSRQKTNECSLVKTNYNDGKDPKARLLSCARVEDELIPPINTEEYFFGEKAWKGYCYGKELGNLSNLNLTDNWFCCQDWQEETSTRNQPK